MASTAYLIFGVDVRMRELWLIFALWVVCSPCVHACTHVERLDIVSVRNHLREEDTSATVPCGHHYLVNHSTVGTRAAIFPLVRRILFFDGVDIGECSYFIPRISAGVNQIDLDSSLSLYLQQVMGSLQQFELIGLQLSRNDSFVDIFRDVSGVRLTYNDLDLVLDDHNAFNLTAVLHCLKYQTIKCKSKAQSGSAEIINILEDRIKIAIVGKYE